MKIKREGAVFFVAFSRGKFVFLDAELFMKLQGGGVGGIPWAGNIVFKYELFVPCSGCAWLICLFHSIGSVRNVWWSVIVQADLKYVSGSLVCGDH